MKNNDNPIAHIVWKNYTQIVLLFHIFMQLLFVLIMSAIYFNH
jgi:hypothetical protein